MIERVPLIVAPTSAERRAIARAHRNGVRVPVAPPTDRRGMGQFFRVLLGQSGGGGGGGPAFKTITIDHTKCGTADTTGFVMLFSTTATYLKTVANGGSVQNSNGYDIRFTSDSAGLTDLNWEIVKYDGMAGQFVARVNIPTLSHTADTVIYLQYGDNTITTFQGGSAGAIYDANYKGFWGWGDGSTLSLSDLTTSANNGTNNNAAVAAAGPNGLGGISFTAASTNYVTTASTLNLAHVTEEILMKFSNPGGTPAWSLCGITQGNGGGTNDKEIGFTLSAGNATLSWYVFPAGVLTAAAALSPDAWHHVAAVADGTNQILYVDGVSVASQAAGDTFTGYTAPGFQVCGNLKAGTFQYGTFIASDTRISSVGRSASCILATSNSFLSPSTFYTLS